METQSFTQFILLKAKGLFGTDRLENDDVCAYYVRHLTREDAVKFVESNSLKIMN